MAIANGTYIIVSAKDTSKALDVSCNSDAKGANVQLWSKNGKSGQYVTVTGSGTKQVLRFPLTGKVVDVYQARAAATQNIIQWVGHGGDCQAWNIVATGSSVTISGTSYPTYYIETALTSSVTQQHLVLALKNDATANGTNVQLLYYNSSKTARQWAFIPVPLLPKGNYRFVSALDQSVCVAAANNNDGGKIIAAGIDLESNNQIWTVRSNVSNVNIVNYGSRCYLNAGGSSAGSAVTQSAKINGQNTSWLLTTEGTMKLNGATYPLVVIRSEAGHDAGSETCVDVGRDADKLGTDAKLYNYHGRSGQKFIAVPAVPLDISIAAPSAPRAAYSKGGTAYVNIWGNGKTTAYPCWISNYTQFQFRYRHRVRKATAGDDVRSSWSAWQSYDSTANDGWGTLSASNVKVTKQADPSGQMRCYSQAHTYTLSTTGNDLVEYQYQVRAISNGKRGAFATAASGKYIYRPTLTVNHISWSPSGISLEYVADQKRNNNDMVIYSITCVHGGKTKTVYDGKDVGYLLGGIKYSGWVTLPQKNLSYIPAEGDSVTVVLRYTNVDGAYKVAKQTVTKPCEYMTSSGLILQPTVEVTSGKMLHVKTNASDVAKQSLWIDYGDDQRYYQKYNDDDGEWYVPVLFNREYRLWLNVEKSDGTWGTYNRLMPAIPDEYCYWFNYINTSGNQDFVRLKYNDGGAPSLVRSIAPSNDAFQTNGSQFEVVHFGKGRSETISIEGIIPNTWKFDASTDNKFDNLSLSHYAWFRGEVFGGRYNAFRVAITNLDIDYSNPAYTKVSVSMRRIANPSDW